MEFKACLKKEFLEAKRGKKFISIFGMSVMFSLFAILYVVIMKFASSMIQVDNSEMQVLFNNTYGASMGFYGAFMTTYFFIVLLFMFSNSISKELNSKQWILPINAGIKPKNLIASKIISGVITVAISFIASALIHLVLTILLCESDGKTIESMLLSYLSIFIFLEFITIVTISLNAISKKRWVPMVVILGFFLLVSSVLQNIVLETIEQMGKITLNDYTPFFFQNYPLNFVYSVSYPLKVWLSASLTTMGISIAFVVWALVSFKVKPEKTILLQSKKQSIFLFKKTEEENE